MKVTVTIKNIKPETRICAVCGREHPARFMFHTDHGADVCFLCACDMWNIVEQGCLTERNADDLAVACTIHKTCVDMGSVQKMHALYAEKLLTDPYFMNEYDDFFNMALGMARERLAGCNCPWENVYKTVYYAEADKKFERRAKILIGKGLDVATHKRLLYVVRPSLRELTICVEQMLRENLMPVVCPDCGTVMTNCIPIDLDE